MAFRPSSAPGFTLPSWLSLVSAPSPDPGGGDLFFIAPGQQVDLFAYEHNSHPNDYPGSGLQLSGGPNGSVYMQVASNGSFLELRPTTGSFAAQTVTQTGGATGGTYTLDLEGITVGPLAFNADQATVQAAFNAAFGAGVITIPGFVLPDFTLQYAINGWHDLPTLSDNSLTGGSNPNVIFADQNIGAETQFVNTLGVFDINGQHQFQVQPDGKIALYGVAGSLQFVAIPDAAGGIVIDAEARTALNALLADLRVRGDLVP